MPDRLTLSYHAWQRWCERVAPIGYDALHDHLMTPARIRAIANGVYRIILHEEGVALHVRSGVITTVIPLDRPRRRIRRSGAWRERRRERGAAA